MKKLTCIVGITVFFGGSLLFAVPAIAAPEPGQIVSGQPTDPRSLNVQRAQPETPTLQKPKFPPRNFQVSKTTVKTNLNVSMYDLGNQPLNLSPVVYQNQFCDSISSAGQCLNPRGWFKIPALRVSLVKFDINFAKGTLLFHKSTNIPLDCTGTPTGGNCLTLYENLSTPISIIDGHEAQQQCNRVPSPGNHASTWAGYEYPTSWTLNIADTTGKLYFEESYFPIPFRFRCHW